MERQTHSDPGVAVGQTNGATPAMPESLLGVSASMSVPALQQDAFKEIINKLAWVLGSTYRQPYSNQSSLCRRYALRIAQAVIRDHGYPAKISVPEAR